MINVELLVNQAVRDNASDIFLVCNVTPKYKRDKKIFDMGGTRITSENCGELIKQVLTPDEVGRFKVNHVINKSVNISKTRCRFHVYSQNGIPAFSIRVLRENTDINNLNIPQKLLDLVDNDNGLIIIGGSNGSGRTTTVFNLLNKINKTSNKHIVTLENPIEYIYKSENSLISQRELTNDFTTYSSGIVDARYESADVIVIDELNDREAILEVINALDGGCLVICVVKGTDNKQILDNLINKFENQDREFIRQKINEYLLGVITQNLISTKKSSNILAYELSFGKSNLDNITLKQSLDKLINSGLITLDTYNKYNK